MTTPPVFPYDTKVRIFIVFILLFSFAPVTGYANCIPGIPCLEEFTPDDPTTVPAESNLPVGHNDPKHDYSDACDSDLMNVIYNEAYLQAERQNLVTEAIIRKPDSVLDYSCFDQMVSRGATIAAGVFSETQYWNDRFVPMNTPLNSTGGKTQETTGEINTVNIDSVRSVEVNTFMPDDRMDKAILNVVIESLKRFTSGSFIHNFLGGEIPAAADQRPVIHTTAYNCPRMAAIYHWAKCENFNNAEDGFFDFEQMMRVDIRQLPQSCAALPELFAPDRIDVANNKDFLYADIHAQDENYLDEITGNNCKGPRATGLTLKIERVITNNGEFVRRETEQFTDAFCVNPRCYYNGSDCVSY